LSHACSLIRPLPHYRHEAFEAGLKAAGYTVGRQPKPGPGALLIIWNRYGTNDDVAAMYEAAGGKVLVAENGYFGRDEPDGPWYAISVGQHHHGGANVPEISPIKGLKPWRKEGDHILICAQRGFGSKVMGCPGWAERIAAELRTKTKRPIRLRQHPGNHAPKVPLYEDLAGCHAVVLWSSNSGIEALIQGVPVFYGAPRWIAEKAALPLAGADLEQPFMGDRTAGLSHAAANQYSVEEIASGEPFRRLLPTAG
jgi:hypothetical protein